MQRLIPLSPKHCKILRKLLKNGLQVFQYLHNPETHNEDKEKLVDFLKIFSSIRIHVNFVDIMTSSTDIFFRHMLIYARICPDMCLQKLMAPFFGHKQYWKYFAEILTRYLTTMIHNTKDELEFLHPFYEFKDDFHIHIERLLKFPFKCLSNFGED